MQTASFLQETQTSQEMGEEVRVGEEFTEEGDEEEDQTQEEE